MSGSDCHIFCQVGEQRRWFSDRKEDLHFRNFTESDTGMEKEALPEKEQAGRKADAKTEKSEEEKAPEAAVKREEQQEEKKTADLPAVREKSREKKERHPPETMESHGDISTHL